MRKIFLLFGLLLFTSVVLYSQNKIITIDNASDFVDAIGSNRTIQLRGAAINLSSVSNGKHGINFRFDEEFDGYELVITGVDNLKIVGLGNEHVPIITKPQYGDVISFENCNNITIENVNAGHGPEKGYCTGGVFHFSNSKNITINNTIMYGSGINGIDADTVTGLQCNNSVIRGCTYGIMVLDKCKNIEFNNCEFSENEVYYFIAIYDCTSIQFHSCIIRNNIFKSRFNNDSYLFEIESSNSVILKNSKIQNNSIPFFYNDMNTLDVCNTEFYGNSFNPIINPDCSLNDEIKYYVENKVNEWQQKGEFEKTVDYRKRVNETTRKQKVQKLTDDAVIEMKKQYQSSINWNSLSLSPYDADNETYLIKSSELGNVAISVPVSDAQSFKQNFNSMKFKNPDFYIEKNKFVLAKVDIISPSGRIYKYDSKQATTYASSNITYNFKPIEVDVKQDNTAQNNTKIENETTIVGTADVDLNIPVNGQTNDKTFAVIIANENYQKEVKVQYAVNDGKVFKEYCEKTLGIPSRNIHFAQDASFGNMKSEIRWICDVASAYNGQAKIIFYYAGHGMPNEADKSAYLLPVDGFSTDFESAIKLDELYNRLTANPSQSVTVFLDACFSGSVRDDGMLANARSVKVKPKTNIISGNMVVFSAATGEETAYPYKEKQHGLFTYFLLKKLQETKGDVDYQTLSNYLTENVKQQSIVVNQKSQTPQVNASFDIQNTWQTMKIK